MGYTIYRNGKLIIIEGVDGAGKTTLIEGLKKTIEPDYVFNYSYPKEPTSFQCGAFAKGEYYASIRIFKELLARGKVIICDRFHLGEYAYGPIKRDYPKWFADTIKDEVEDYMLTQINKDQIYLVILVLGQGESIRKRIKDFNKEYPKDHKEIEAINDRYLWVNSKLQCIGIYTDALLFNNYPEIILKEVVEFIRK